MTPSSEAPDPAAPEFSASDPASTHPFAGLSTAVLTPMTADGALDEGALTRHVRRLVEGGVDVLMPCGTTGESVTLSPDEHQQVVAIVVEAAGGQVPVVAGAGGSSTAGACELARRSRAAGADGLLCVTPAYNKPTQAGLRGHFLQVAEEGGGLPIILYNVPGRTAVHLSADTVLELAQDPRFVGVKEASGELALINTLLGALPRDFLVLAGDDELALPVLALGGHGVVSVVANEAPGLMSALVRTAQSGDFGEARRIHRRLLPLMRANFIESNPAPVKEACHILGWMEPHVRRPLARLETASAATLRAALETADLLSDASDG